MTAVMRAGLPLHDRFTSFLLALGLHLTIIAAGSTPLLLQPARYGVQPGLGGIEVQLVAAPAIAVGEKKTAGETRSEMAGAETLEQDDFVLPATSPERPTEPASTTSQTSESLTSSSWPAQGDGSSPIAGFDSTTWYSPGGAISAAHPRHLRNPAPPYPTLSRERGEEGRVLLLVYVSKTGEPVRVELSESSGFPLLDQSAIATIRRWKFSPAQAGPLPVDSKVKIPIRFVLNDTQGGLE